MVRERASSAADRARSAASSAADTVRDIVSSPGSRGETASSVSSGTTGDDGSGSTGPDDSDSPEVTSSGGGSSVSSGGGGSSGSSGGGGSSGSTTRTIRETVSDVGGDIRERASSTPIGEQITQDVGIAREQGEAAVSILGDIGSSISSTVEDPSDAVDTARDVGSSVREAGEAAAGVGISAPASRIDDIQETARTTVDSIQLTDDRGVPSAGQNVEPATPSTDPGSVDVRDRASDLFGGGGDPDPVIGPGRNVEPFDGERDPSDLTPGDVGRRVGGAGAAVFGAVTTPVRDDTRAIDGPGANVEPFDGDREPADLDGGGLAERFRQRGVEDPVDATGLFGRGPDFPEQVDEIPDAVQRDAAPIETDIPVQPQQQQRAVAFGLQSRLGLRDGPGVESAALPAAAVATPEPASTAVGGAALGLSAVGVGTQFDETTRVGGPFAPAGLPASEIDAPTERSELPGEGPGELGVPDTTVGGTGAFGELDAPTERSELPAEGAGELGVPDTTVGGSGSQPEIETPERPPGDTTTEIGVPGIEAAQQIGQVRDEVELLDEAELEELRRQERSDVARQQFEQTIFEQRRDFGEIERETLPERDRFGRRTFDDIGAGIAGQGEPETFGDRDETFAERFSRLIDEGAADRREQAQQPFVSTGGETVAAGEAEDTSLFDFPRDVGSESALAETAPAPPVSDGIFGVGTDPADGAPMPADSEPRSQPGAAGVGVGVFGLPGAEIGPEVTAESEPLPDTEPTEASDLAETPATAQRSEVVEEQAFEQPLLFEQVTEPVATAPEEAFVTVQETLGQQTAPATLPGISAQPQRPGRPGLPLFGASSPEPQTRQFDDEEAGPQTPSFENPVATGTEDIGRLFGF